MLIALFNTRLSDGLGLGACSWGCHQMLTMVPGFNPFLSYPVLIPFALVNISFQLDQSMKRLRALYVKVILEISKTHFSFCPTFHFETIALLHSKPIVRYFIPFDQI